MGGSKVSAGASSSEESTSAVRWCAARSPGPVDEIGAGCTVASAGPATGDGGGPGAERGGGGPAAQGGAGRARARAHGAVIYFARIANELFGVSDRICLN